MRDRYVLLAFDALTTRAASTPAGAYGPPDDDWAGALRDVLAASDTARSAAPDAIRPHLTFPWHRPDRMHADRAGEDWWRHHESTFADALAAVDVPRRQADAVARTVRDAYLDAAAWSAVDGAADALDRLRDAGWNPVVYLNGPPEVDALLSAAGLDNRVTASFTSALTGYELPHARAFETVEDALGGGRVWFAGRDPDHAAGALNIGVPGVVVAPGDRDVAPSDRDVAPSDHDVPPGARSVASLSGLADLLEGR